MSQWNQPFVRFASQKVIVIATQQVFPDYPGLTQHPPYSRLGTRDLFWLCVFQAGGSGEFWCHKSTSVCGRLVRSQCWLVPVDIYCRVWHLQFFFLQALCPTVLASTNREGFIAINVEKIERKTSPLIFLLYECFLYPQKVWNLSQSIFRGKMSGN